MENLGKLLCSFKPDKVGFFGNRTTNVEVYSQGIRLERTKGNEEYTFADIDKITAHGYASPNPIYIFITIFLKNNSKKIELKLHPNLTDTNALLNAYSDYLLGEDFPDNFDKVDIELGGLGASMRLKNGKILLGDREIDPSEVELFARNKNGFYNFKLSPIKQTLGISPDYAQNILATIKVMNEIMRRNQS